MCDEISSVNAHQAQASGVCSPDLQKVRVVQRTLIYVIGLPPHLAKPEILVLREFFGQYGKIKKCVMNSHAFTSPQGLSYSAYIHFTAEIEATLCIRAVNCFTLCSRILKVTFGTTKYCSYFLKKQPCLKGDCLYLHELGNPLDTYREIPLNRHIQPHISVFDLIRTVVSEPVGNFVLPSIAFARNRFASEEIVRSAPKKDRLYSEDISPIKAKSRFGFNEGDEEGAAVPRVLYALVSKNSAIDRECVVSKEEALELFKEDWAGDILQGVTQQEEVLVRALF